MSELPPCDSIDRRTTDASSLEYRQAGNNPRISGSNYWGGNNFTLNGISVNDPGNGGVAYTSGISGLSTANFRLRIQCRSFE